MGNRNKVKSALAVWPNMAAKGTRRTRALLKVGGLIGFVGFVKVLQTAHPLLLR